MFAVVQIGSSERRSPCITARMVRAREGCARVMLGMPETAAAAAAAAAAVPCTKRRRVVRMEVLPLGFPDLVTERRSGTSPLSNNHPPLRQLRMRPDDAARFRERVLARVERRGALTVAIDAFGPDRRGR